MQKTQRLSVTGYINAVTWNSDGSRLAALSDFGGTVSIFEVASWQKIKTFKRYGGSYSANSFAFLPDGTLLTAAAVADRPVQTEPNGAILSLIQWDPSTGSPLQHIPGLGYPPKQPSFKVRPTDVFAFRGRKDRGWT